jgi:hypothetical protein
MPEIFVIKDGRTINQHTLGPDGLVVGRAVEADLQLDSTLVSRQHARFVFEAGNYAIQDLQSGNGVFVNGTREYHRLLQPDDRVEIGGFILLFSPTAASHVPPRGAPRATRPPPPQAAPTGGVNLEGGVTPDQGVGSGATMNIDSAELARLMREKRDQLEARFVMAMETGEKVYPLKKDRYTVGFHRDCDLRLPGEDGPKIFTVSKRGSEVDLKAVGLFAKIEINGERQRKRTLAHGDEVNARGVILRFKAAGKQ